MRILISNDDGVHAPGLKILAKEFSKLGTVWVVAPLVEKSTTGHSLTLHKPLRLLPMGERFFGVSGSPADCVYLGVREVIGGEPDLVVSGINRGANLGQDVYYSGTVSAAREACMMGFPSLAVSLSVNYKKPVKESELNYLTAAKYASQLVRDIDLKKLPVQTLLNLNTPDLPFAKVKGLAWVRQGFRHYSSTVVKRRDHRGKDYFWVGGHYKGFRNEEGTDCVAVSEGYASVSPMKLDCTDYSILEAAARGEYSRARKGKR